MGTPKILTIKEITRYIKITLEQDRQLNNVWLRGEISNFKLHNPSGHMYFTLKDQTACLKAVMFRSRAAHVPFKPEHGMKVIVRGTIGVFERDGQYQIYVEEMLPDGLGAQYLALEQLKVKLAAEGLFSQERKRSLPVLPRTVGVATSITGAAVRDILKVTYRRFPNMQVIIAPCIVQGDQAPSEIVNAINMLNSRPEVDVIIVGRGGGSGEDLAAFNNEAVVRAIAASTVPVISAVGHEVDTTLADLAADLRAPTPSAAAELAVPSKVELAASLSSYRIRLSTAIQKDLASKRKFSELLAASPVLTNPIARLNQMRQFLDQLQQGLHQNVTNTVREKGAILNVLTEKLDALSPLKVLARGYSICQGPTGETISDAATVKVGQDLTVTLSKGKLSCNVKEVITCQNP